MITVICWSPYREINLDTSLEDFLKRLLSDKGVKSEKTDMGTYSFKYCGLDFTIFP